MEPQIIIAALGVVVALFGYAINIRNSIKTRQAQLFMSLYSHFHQPEFWDQYAEVIFLSDYEGYDDFWQKYGPAEKESFSRWMSFGTYFTGIAVLIDQNLIDISLVDALIGDYVVWIWQKLEPVLTEIEKVEGENQTLRWMRFLHKRIQIRRKIRKSFKHVF